MTSIKGIFRLRTLYLQKLAILVLSNKLNYWWKMLSPLSMIKKLSLCFMPLPIDVVVHWNTFRRLSRTEASNRPLCFIFRGSCFWGWVSGCFSCSRKKSSPFLSLLPQESNILLGLFQTYFSPISAPFYAEPSVRLFVNYFWFLVNSAKANIIIAE